MWLAGPIAEGSSDPHFPLALKVRIRTLRGPESSGTTACDNAKFGSKVSRPRKVRIQLPWSTESSDPTLPVGQFLMAGAADVACRPHCGKKFRSALPAGPESSDPNFAGP
jgi:hypothetical protein